jgi:hypothetical protein
MYEIVFTPTVIPEKMFRLCCLVIKLIAKAKKKKTILFIQFIFTVKILRSEKSI